MIRPKRPSSKDPQTNRYFHTEISARWVSFLSQQIGTLIRVSGKLRPWEFWELHNPWSRVSTRIDSWGFLELCQSEELVSALVPLLGADLILFDSQILPNPALPAKSGVDVDGSAFFPVEPFTGIVVRIPFVLTSENAPGAVRVQPHSLAISDRNLTAESVQGTVPIRMHTPALNIDSSMVERVPSSFEYIIRYFAGSSRYIRDPNQDKQRLLREAFPWINYLTMPLWLVSGVDKANNDFVSGFQARPGRWTTAKA